MGYQYKINRAAREGGMKMTSPPPMGGYADRRLGEALAAGHVLHERDGGCRLPVDVIVHDGVPVHDLAGGPVVRHDPVRRVRAQAVVQHLYGVISQCASVSEQLYRSHSQAKGPGTSAGTFSMALSLSGEDPRDCEELSRGPEWDPPGPPELARPVQHSQRLEGGVADVANGRVA